jgi:hypothetical protein
MILALISEFSFVRIKAFAIMARGGLVCGGGGEALGGREGQSRFSRTVA